MVIALLCGGCGSDSNPSGVGNHCEKDADCKIGACYLGPGGGYCTTECMTEGSTSECPVDTICKPIQGGARRCLLVCGSESSCGEATCDADFCPSGSSCASVSNSTSRGCEPNPN
jgi:hypothetical protein